MWHIIRVLIVLASRLLNWFSACPSHCSPGLAADRTHTSLRLCRNRCVGDRVSLCSSTSPSTMNMSLAFDVDDSSVSFLPHSFSSSAQSQAPDPGLQLFRQISGSPQTAIGLATIVLQGDYGFSLVTAFHSFSNDSIGLPVQSGTC